MSRASRTAITNIVKNIKKARTTVMVRAMLLSTVNVEIYILRKKQPSANRPAIDTLGPGPRLNLDRQFHCECGDSADRKRSTMGINNKCLNVKMLFHLFLQEK